MNVLEKKLEVYAAERDLSAMVDPVSGNIIRTDEPTALADRVQIAAQLQR